MPPLTELTWYILAAADLAVSAVGSGHAILHKRDTRAAIAWVGLIWLAPFVGTALYVGLGINRIRRRAHFLRGEPREFTPDATWDCSPEQLRLVLGPDASHLDALAQLVGRVTRCALTTGNTISSYEYGDEAYPEMLGTIESACHSISLCTYIFDHDRAGSLFVKALAAAVRRGVEVRVLIDDVGSRYGYPPITRILRREKVNCAAFLPTFVPWRFRYLNLRNHRKLLVTDGRVGFTGGMNIREGNYRDSKRHPIQDIHFRIEGPMVRQLQETFAIDWAFTTEEQLGGQTWFPPPIEAGSVIGRGIADGPDEDFEQLRWTLLGAVSCAKSRIVVLTPYFLPDATLITALNVAAMRGVEVDIILPRRSNLHLVQWASRALYWQLLERGCRIWLSPPPFDHSKLVLVDDVWVFIGSANWDARSLRLNFEFNIELYDRTLAGKLRGAVEEKLARSEVVTLEEVDARPLPARLRDGLARLASPYL